ncbi:MAG: shikimate kinase [Ginsengibacter sp.]
MLNDQNIFLIGFMGSGKSYWGHRWALENGYTFYDLDDEIEKAFGMTIEKIFEKHGEEKFRELERSHLRKFEANKNCLIASGGGAPCFFDNLEWMKQHGTIIYLKASPEYILMRIMNETFKRPLLKELNSSELLSYIQTKLKEREPAYSKAHYILEVEKLNNNSLNFLKKKL